ncbi:MAG: hypothetical protein U0838_15040 [Chloroflexota bacterium]
MPTGSKPEFSQNVESSMAVVASTMLGGMSLNSRTVRFSVPNVASCVVPSRAVTTDCWISWIFSRSRGSGRFAESEM